MATERVGDLPRLFVNASLARKELNWNTEFSFCGYYEYAKSILINCYAANQIGKG